jgi:hypothetical protein
MEKQRLLETLEELHAQLSRAERVDPDTLKMLRALTDDIDRLVEKKGNGSAAEVEPVSNGLRDLILKFEADHPQFSNAIGKVADALAAMGI